MMEGVNKTNSTVFLQLWNDEIASRYVWNIVILVFLLLLGVAGNAVVILVYGFKMRESMDHRLFIPVLAVVDLLATIMVCILCLNESISPVTRTDIVFCKSVNYFVYSISSNSLFLLAIIAVQRYLKICRPFGYQMNLRAQVTAICTSTLFAFVLFSPLIYFYRIETVLSPSGITGYICTVLHYDKQSSLVYFQLTVFVVYMFAIILMAVLYIFVAREIIKSQKHLKKRQFFPIQKHFRKPVGDEKDENVDDVAKEVDELSLQKRAPRKGEKHFAVYRYSYIFMIITIKATVAFIGPWIISASVGSNDNWNDSTQNYVILRKMFLLSHVTNPIIYGLLDTKFKDALKSCFRTKTFYIDSTV